MLTAWIWGYRLIAKPHLKTELDNSWTIWKGDQAEQEATANLLGPENLLALGHKGGGGGLAEWWPSRGCLSPSLFLWPQTGLTRLKGWYSQTERTQISGTPSTSKPQVSSTISQSPHFLGSYSNCMGVKLHQLSQGSGDINKCSEKQYKASKLYLGFSEMNHLLRASWGWTEVLKLPAGASLLCCELWLSHPTNQIFLILSSKWGASRGCMLRTSKTGITAKDPWDPYVHTHFSTLTGSCQGKRQLRFCQ